MAVKIRAGAGAIAGRSASQCGIKDDVVAAVDVFGGAGPGAVMAKCAGITGGDDMGAMLADLGAGDGAGKIAVARHSGWHTSGRTVTTATDGRSSIAPDRKCRAMTVESAGRGRAGFGLGQVRSCGRSILAATHDRASDISTSGLAKSIETDIDITALRHFIGSFPAAMAGVAAVTFGIGVQGVFACGGAGGGIGRIEGRGQLIRGQWRTGVTTGTGSFETDFVLMAFDTVRAEIMTLLSHCGA